MTTAGTIEKTLADALGDRYLAYALSTIVARSLPDVRDGLKPVHRRLLFAMRELGLNPARPPKKSARVVGDVIGKFHPHGDVAVYEALVRLAQDFSQRFPLIDGQGNFGNIDGDFAAAMRYTEARLTELGIALLDGLDADAVDFRETYDGDGTEPVVLPAAFPNLLANGATGIAVGMATSIPPHNAGEIADALIHLLNHPDASIDALVDRIVGPDFPTGGVLVESREGIVAAYATGRGSFRLRARFDVERLPLGAWQIIVTQIPYQVPKSRLIERIAALLEEKRIPALDDVRDESADDVRIVLVPKSRNVDPDQLMEQLFRQTDLEVRVPLNMNVLDRHTVPRVMNLRDVLQAFIDHRLEVLERTTRFRLRQIASRLELLDGYLIAYLNLDEVIATIRESDDASLILIERFALNERQADAILNMRLRALHRLEEIEIRREHARLGEEQTELEGILSTPQRQKEVITQEIADIKKRFGKATRLGRRRTDLTVSLPDIDVVADVVTAAREAVTILLSQQGWIRAVRGHAINRAEVRYKEGDGERFVVDAWTDDRLLAFASNGRCFTLDIDRLARGRGFGEPVRLLVDLGEADIISLFVYSPGREVIVAASDGRGFRLLVDNALAQTRAGRQVLNLLAPVSARICVPVCGDAVAVIGTNRQLTVFLLEEVPQMVRGRGVILQRYQDASLSDLVSFDLAAGLIWKSGDRVRTEDMRPWLQPRGGRGRLPPHGFPRDNRFT